MKLIPIPLVFIFFNLFIYCENISLTFPIVEDSPEQHLFFLELLETALIKDGNEVTIITESYPQVRIKRLLENGSLPVFWMVESAERNEKYLPVKIGLTNGLIGKRILFINKNDQSLYDNVKTLGDFRKLNLIGGMGQNWFDVKVWQANDLKYKEHPGNWKRIFSMISAGLEYDYFSRGLNEILRESQKYPDLAIEDKLVLIYDRDFFFYLSKSGNNSGSKYQQIIESALFKAKNSGLIEKLVRKYWADDFEILDFDNRVQINLKTPK